MTVGRGTRTPCLEVGFVSVFGWRRVLCPCLERTIDCRRPPTRWPQFAALWPTSQPTDRLAKAATGLRQRRRAAGAAVGRRGAFERSPGDMRPLQAAGARRAAGRLFVTPAMWSAGAHRHSPADRERRTDCRRRPLLRGALSDDKTAASRRGHAARVFERCRTQWPVFWGERH